MVILETLVAGYVGKKVYDGTALSYLDTMTEIVTDWQGHVAELASNVSYAYQDVVKDYIAPWLETTYEALLPQDRTAFDPNEEIITSSASLGVSIVGFVIPPLNLFNVPSILYSARYIFENAFESLTKREVGAAFLAGVIIIALLIWGYFVTLNVALLMFVAGYKWLA